MKVLKMTPMDLLLIVVLTHVIVAVLKNNTTLLSNLGLQ